MKWLQVEISTTSLCADVVSDFLINLGADGVSIADKKDVLDIKNAKFGYDYIDENILLSYSDEVKVKTCLKPNDKNIILIEDFLSNLKSNMNDDFCGSLDFKIQILDDKLWKNEWKKFYKPLNIDGIRIVPDFKKNLFHSDSNACKEVYINPGMAFGTGQHETTSMCIRFLQTVPLENGYIIDVGCGSGILAITALKLGAKKAECVDTEQQAIKATLKNATLNKVQDKILLNHGVLSNIGIKADVIVANITASILDYISQDIAKRIKDSGFLILSGIITGREQEVLNTYTLLGFKLIDTIKQGDWTAYKMQFIAERV